MKRLPLIVVITGIVWSGFAIAAESSADSALQHLTLEAARQIALDNYPLIRSADLRTNAAKQEVKATRASYFPQATGNAVRAFADRGTRIAAPGGLNDPTVIDRGSAGVSLSQLITDFGRTSDLVESSKLQLEAQKQRASFTRFTALLDVTRAYYNLLRAESLLKVAKDTLKTRKTLLDQVSSLRDAKMKSDLDRSIARQDVDDANLLLLRANAGVDDAQALLSEALGYSDSRQFILAETKGIAPPPVELAPIVQDAITHNPELATLTAEKKAAEKLADAETKAQYPTVSALGFVGDTPFHASTQPIDYHYAAAGINISIPLFTGGRLTAQEKEARYKAEATAQDEESKKNQLLRDIRVAFDNTQTAYKNIEVTAQFLKNTSEALELTQERYKIGKSSIVDLSQAHLAHTQAQIANTNATYEYLIQLAILEYKTGSTLAPYSEIHRRADAAN